MKSSILLCLSLLILVTLVSTTEANILRNIKDFIKDLFSSKDDSDKPSKKQHQAWKICRGKPLNATQLEFATEECDHEYEISDTWSNRRKTKIRQSTCFRACQLEHLGWVWENGSYTNFNHTMAKKSIDAIFPEKAVAGIKTGISKCFDEASDLGTLSDDDHCHSYRPVLRCIDKVLYQNCKTPKGGKGRKRTTTTTTEEPAITTTEEEDDNTDTTDNTTDSTDDDDTTEGSTDDASTTEESSDDDNEAEEVTTTETASNNDND